jgi:HK97 gp10 family phage protein
MAVTNLKSVLKSLEKFGDEAKQMVSDTTHQSAENIARDAKEKAPTNKIVGYGGFLRSQIFTQEVDALNYEIVAGAYYSAYMEFGTGGLVNVPSEMKDIAIKFKGKGVKQVNIMPRPFLYPAFVKGRVQYLEDLIDLLNDLTKKYN